MNHHPHSPSNPPPTPRAWLGAVSAALLWAVGSGLHAAPAPASAPTPAPALSPDQTQFFESKIRPVLAKHCYKCHASDSAKVKGGLLLDSREGLLKGGDTGPAVVSGDPDKSLLIKAIRYTDPDLQMPPKGEKLTDAQIADLVAWVKMGAPDPRTGKATARKAAHGKDHWAFQPVKQPAIPAPGSATAGGSTNPIDAFIGAKLAENGLTPSPAADKRTLLRRVYFDLIGLPPTPEETQAFLDDTAPDAFARVVDRLLASPRYGERWGRHWLDVARYSDTKGDIRRQRDTPTYPFAWTYRDYVIKAFNDDKPYDRFILEQIAADLLPQGRDNSALAAMGFLTVGERFQNNPNDIINDRIDVVTKGFLGLTVSCARCHDHMFDPIPTEDYYSLHGVFASSPEPRLMPILGDPTRNPAYPDYYKQRVALEKEVDEVEEKLQGLRRAAGNGQQQRQQLQRDRIQILNRIDALDLTHAGSPVRAMTLSDSPKPKDSRVFIRGEAENKGATVPRRFLECLSGPDRRNFSRGSGRLELAAAIASKSNPLTARVMVNRIWQHHFGEGLVATPDDFGTMGAAPTHPELLDYLAAEFMQRGWSVKAMHRLIVNSATYQQSSTENARYAQIDPFNKLLWRANVRRLEFEPLRDSLLAYGGRLDTNMYGKPVPLAASKGRGQLITVALEPSHRAVDVGYTTRRTVYGYVDRSDLPEVFNHFDFANPDLPNGHRHQTTVPQQALYLMNSPLVVEQARHLVERPDVKGCSTDEDRIRRVYEIIYQRPPRADEIRLGLDFLADAATPEDRPVFAANSSQPTAAAARARVKGQAATPRARREALLAGRQPGVRDARPLSAWAEYTHALLLANEASFVN